MTATGRAPTAHQERVWEAVQRLGTQRAAAMELGTTQGSVQSALKGYMANAGLEGPLPGSRHMGTGRPPGYSRAAFQALEAEIRRLRAALKSSSLRAQRRAEQEAWSPLCMDPDERDLWREMNARLSVERAQRPCDDCPMSFALEMFAARRCNGVPGQD